MNWWKINKIFVENNFTDCSLVRPKDTTLLNFTGETFVNGHKTSKIFSLESFTLHSLIYEREREKERERVCVYDSVVLVNTGL